MYIISNYIGFAINYSSFAILVQCMYYSRIVVTLVPSSHLASDRVNRILAKWHASWHTNNTYTATYVGMVVWNVAMLQNVLFLFVY